MRRASLILLPLVLLAAAASLFVKAGHNPPGYYIDEASISYNAHTIAQTGRDEFGVSWPLYFRAFGDYKNPVYLYLLAGIYSLTGPGVTVARLFSAILGLLTAAAFGALAWRITRNRTIALLGPALLLLTPWSFQLSRIVLEVSLYPFVVLLFLLCLHRSAQDQRWTWTDACSLAAALALLTYSYSIGRLLGPLLALGLVFFASTGRRLGIALTWLVYLLLVSPILYFNHTHPDALSSRFRIITYLDTTTSPFELALKFGLQFLGNLNPWLFFVTGDPNPEQIAHIDGTPLLSIGAGFLVVTGLIIVVGRQLHDPWWRFVLYGLVMSIVPASLTNESVHMLRLAPMLVFLLVLAIPAMDYLLTGGRTRTCVLACAAASIVVQAAIFQWQFHASAHSRRRLRQFDHGYPGEIFQRAVAISNRPIYLADALWIPGYIQAYWNAVLQHVPVNQFVRLAPDEPAPAGGLVISTEENCPRCVVVATSEFYSLYVAQGGPIAHEPLSPGGFQATITVATPPSVVRRREKITLSAVVRNDSNQSWPARERGGGPNQVSLGNHWLDETGQTVANDDGRAALLKRLDPGESVDLKLVVNAPAVSGRYLLELDMLQENVTWFGLKGSRTIRLPIEVK